MAACQQGNGRRWPPLFAAAGRTTSGSLTPSRPLVTFEPDSEPRPQPPAPQAAHPPPARPPQTQRFRGPGQGTDERTGGGARGAVKATPIGRRRPCPAPRGPGRACARTADCRGPSRKLREPTHAAAARSASSEELRHPPRAKVCACAGGCNGSSASPATRQGRGRPAPENHVSCGPAAAGGQYKRAGRQGRWGGVTSDGTGRRRVGRGEEVTQAGRAQRRAERREPDWAERWWRGVASGAWRREKRGIQRRRGRGVRVIGGAWRRGGAPPRAAGSGWLIPRFVAWSGWVR